MLFDKPQVSLSPDANRLLFCFRLIIVCEVIDAANEFITQTGVLVGYVFLHVVFHNHVSS